MSKLWQKNYTLDTLIEKFTVGRDYLLDMALVPSDCVSSIAHAKMLASIDILSGEEADSLTRELGNIIIDHKKGEFSIQLSDEDCHTAIEGRLSEKIGDAGKKIHTGRSRNDQVLTASRVFSRGAIIRCMQAGFALVEALLQLAEEHKDTPMPGRTHMQIAMPSSIGLWAGAFAEEILGDLGLLWSAYGYNDMCPLGSAASYGVPIPLDREMTADSLGFSRVQNNVLYVNNTRGKIESVILESMDQGVLTLSKMAQDLIIFSMPEFDYFNLPAELCSGSSIMPQKKNPDGLELIRSKSGTLSAYVTQIKNIIRSLPSGYNRDFQDTKEPFLRGVELAVQCFDIMTLTISKLKINKEKLIKGFTPDIYATDAAIELVLDGVSFRDAYKEVGLNIDKLENRDAVETIRNRTYTGTTGNLKLDAAKKGLDELTAQVETAESAVNKKIEELVGFPVEIVDF